MAYNDNDRCPLCGKKMHEGETFCDDCREIADISYPSELLSGIESEKEPERKADNPIYIVQNEATPEEDSTETEEEMENSNTNPPPKSNKKLILFVLIGAVVLVLIGGAGSYVFVQNKNAIETQEAYWQQCVEENTPLAYSKYLVQYPEGVYSEQAQDRIIELRENERKEWEELRKTNNIAALSTFLKDHPDTPYARNIRHAIDSLSWLVAIEANTKDAYLAYIDNAKLGHYSGEYTDTAQQKYDYLNQLKAVEGEDLEKISATIKDFFKALSSVNSKDLQKTTTPILLNFYTTQNLESKLISDSIKSSLKKNKIRKESYLPDINAIETMKDSKGIYFSKLPVVVETTFVDKKKKKEENKYIINLEFNNEMLIQSVKINSK